MPSNSHQPHLESSRIGPGYPCGGNGGRLAPCEPGVDTVDAIIFSILATNMRDVQGRAQPRHEMVYKPW